MKNPIKVNTDINSNLPDHICTMYVSFNPAGILGVVIPHDNPTFAAAEVDSNNDSKKGYP